MEEETYNPDAPTQQSSKYIDTPTNEGGKEEKHPINQIYTGKEVED